MATPPKPNSQLAKKTLSRPLFQSLSHVFSQNITGCVLAGGTALAGFYAKHRRSDDLDFFTENPESQRAATLAVKSLASIGVELKTRQDSAQYFAGTGKLDGHLFQVTVVLDANLFRVSAPVSLAGNIRVVDLNTLFKMKAATLVSRCSEKDLYDLIWIFRQFPERTYSDLIKLGNEIDAGVNGEDILSSVSGAMLREEACDFSLDRSKNAKVIYAEILDFRKALLKGLQSYLENDSAPPLGALVQKLEKLKR